MSATRYLQAQRDAIVAAFVEHLKPLKVTVAYHDGPFGDDELERYSVSAPSVIIAMEGGKSKRIGGTIKRDENFRAFIITKGKPHEKRSDALLFILEHVLRLLHDTPEQWPGKAPADIEDRNLYSSEVDMTGMCLWKVGWLQVLEIPAELQPEDLEDFLRLYNTFTSAQPTEDPDEPQVAIQHINLPPTT